MTGTLWLLNNTTLKIGHILKEIALEKRFYERI